MVRRTIGTVVVTVLFLVCFNFWLLLKLSGGSTQFGLATNDLPGYPSSKEETDSLMLSVPFYVYEEMAWVDATIGGIPVSESIGPGMYQKHSNDYWFMMASLKHPMRTRDPEKAKLFVVPTLLNMYSLRVYESSQRNVTMCWKGMCDKELLKHAARVLNSTSFIQTIPHLHIVTTSHFGYRLKGKLNMPAILRQMLYKCNSITFEQKVFNDAKRQQFSSYLVGNACPQPEKSTTFGSKPFDVTMIATLKPDDDRFLDRERICQWLNHSTANVTFKVPVCGRGQQCPALAHSRLGFHVRGDTFGSQRLMDTILSGTVPIFTRKEQYDVQPRWIDWDQLSYFIDMAKVSEQGFQIQLQEILSNTSLYETKLRAVLTHHRLFDWTTLFPFDTYMYMLQAELYPETRASSSTWGALKLP